MKISTHYDLGIDYAADGTESHTIWKVIRNEYTGEIITKEAQTLEYNRHELHAEYCPVCRGDIHNPELHKSVDNFLTDIYEFQKSRSKQIS